VWRTLEHVLPGCSVLYRVRPTRAIGRTLEYTWWLQSPWTLESKSCQKSVAAPTLAPLIRPLYVDLTGMIPLSRDRGLQKLRHEPLHWPCTLELTPYSPFGTLFLLTGEPSASLFFVKAACISSLWVSRTGSNSDWCALQEALYKCIDTIQYNRMMVVVFLFWK